MSRVGFYKLTILVVFSVLLIGCDFTEEQIIKIVDRFAQEKCVIHINENFNNTNTNLIKIVDCDDLNITIGERLETILKGNISISNGSIAFENKKLINQTL